MTPAAYALRDVEMRYGPRTVLRIGELDVKVGEVLALVGPSGAGKSTLLRLLALLEAPSAGRVSLHLDGREIMHASAATDDRRQIAMVFQRPALLSQSVRTNVGYGLRVRGQRDGRGRIDALLDRLDLLPLAEARPRTLSGGELQRVALARALVLAPRILLLDEPTANLDPYNVSLIERLVREQNADSATTTVLVTHNVLQARRLATRVAFLLEGALVEVAPTEQFFNAPRDARTSAFLSGDLVC
jgi:tungstate transport system ATP-binding protein